MRHYLPRDLLRYSNLVKNNFVSKLAAGREEVSLSEISSEDPETDVRSCSSLLMLETKNCWRLANYTRVPFAKFFVNINQVWGRAERFETKYLNKARSLGEMPV